MAKAKTRKKRAAPAKARRKRRSSGRSKSRSKSSGTVVNRFSSGGCPRQVRAKRVRHRGGGTHMAYYVSKVDPTCGRTKRKAKRRK